MDTPRFTLPDGTLVVSKEEVTQALLDKFGTTNIFWYEEPENVVAEKLATAIATGEEQKIMAAVQSIWGYYFPKGEGRRLDERFFVYLVVRHPKGHYQGALWQERKIPQPEDGSPRVVGRVYAIYNSKGQFAVENDIGLEGNVLQAANTTSVSKSLVERKTLPEGAVITSRRYLYMDVQRMFGAVEFITVYYDEQEANMIDHNIAKAITMDARLFSALNMVS